MKKILIFILFVTSLYANFYESKPIKIGVFKNLSPYSYVDSDNNLEGIMIDYWNLWSKKSNQKIEFVPISFKTFYKDLKEQKVDMFAGMFPTKQREQEILFVNPFYKAKSYVYINTKDTHKNKTIKDIENSKNYLGIIRNTYYQEFIQENYPKIKIKFFDTPVELSLAINSGEIIAFISDSLPVWIEFIKSNMFNKITVLKDFEIDTQFYAAILNKNEMLAQTIIKGAKNIKFSEIETIQNRWVVNDSLKYLKQKQDITLSEEEKLWLLKNPIVQIATIKGRDAYAFKDKNGIIKGFNADLIKQINENLGTTISVKLFNTWDEAYAKAKSGEVDGILDFSYLKEREAYFNFSPAYHYEKTYLITRKNSKKISSIEDIGTKIFSTQKNSIANDIVREKAPKAKIIHRKNIDSIFRAIQNKKADVSLQENIVDYDLDKYNLKVNSEIYTKLGEYTIGTNKKKPVLSSIIKKGINSLTKKQLKDLKSKWFNKKSIFTNIMPLKSKTTIQ